MNRNHLARWRIAFFCAGVVALVVSALLRGEHLWLSAFSLGCFVAWIALLAFQRSAAQQRPVVDEDPDAWDAPDQPVWLRAPAPPPWVPTVPTQPAALDSGSGDSRLVGRLHAHAVLQRQRNNEVVAQDCAEAAEEIERLRAALEARRDWPPAPIAPSWPDRS